MAVFNLCEALLTIKQSASVTNTASRFWLGLSQSRKVLNDFRVGLNGKDAKGPGLRNKLDSFRKDKNLRVGKRSIGGNRDYYIGIDGRVPACLYDPA